MIIGGFQKVSLIDYPGKVASVVFTRGCNFRCGYCHNPELVLPGFFNEPVNAETIFTYLKTRIGKIDGVVITGGEPTIHHDLLEFILKIKELGYLVKLDTNGTYPDTIETLLFMSAIDFIAMDIKAPLMKYPNITNTICDTSKIKKSVEIILNSGIEYEFRTTIVKDELCNGDIVEISRMIKNAKNYFVQNFNKTKVIDAALLASSNQMSNEDYSFLKTNIAMNVPNFAFR